jgi:hypothetical protein
MSNAEEGCIYDGQDIIGQNHFWHLAKEETN